MLWVMIKRVSNVRRLSRRTAVRGDERQSLERSMSMAEQTVASLPTCLELPALTNSQHSTPESSRLGQRLEVLPDMLAHKVVLR